MKASADLEIGLHREDAGAYAIEMRFSQPDSGTDDRLESSTPPLARFDFEGLRALSLDAPAYGRLLSDSLFADPTVRELYMRAMSYAQAQNAPLRLRLFIGPTAPELHSLRWETLRNPQDGSPLLTSEHVLFSRYLSSIDWRPVAASTRRDLRALVVIANPTNVSDYQPGGRALAPVDVTGELARAQASLGSIPLTALASGGSATLNNLSEHLRDGYDILLLVCHGALIDGEARLWLEEQSGRAAVVAGSELVTRLRELQHRPRLVVLASCQSAGSGADTSSSDEGALAALGPRLARAGIPAVLAMQGNVTMETVARFMPVFFKELQRDGQIDRAMAAARGAVRDRPDHWMPVLFMRLRSGRIWYTPGFADEGQRLAIKWPSLLQNIAAGRCTPILGAGLTESLLGSTREIARSWADKYNFPMAPYDREDLPQVAQYLAVNEGYAYPRTELAEYLRSEILHRYAHDLPGEMHNASLDDVIKAVGERRRARDPAEPHRVLAELPFPIYITATADNLLADALTAAGKDPQVELCRWNDDLEQTVSIYDEEPGYRPDVVRPLVYHLLGHIKQPDSVVLTEDDYFDYLIGITSNKDLIPGSVRRALTDTALLFLGFRMEDWDFRVLFRSIVSREGRTRRQRYTHVAVQIDPEGGRISEPERARIYLERYFQETTSITIYWGSAEDFLRELQARWAERARADARLHGRVGVA